MMVKLSKKTLDGNVETLLLAVLQSGPSYGYAIIQDLRKQAEGILNLGEGTIYPVLYRLEERGLIASTWRQGDNGRQRKYYRLTPKGRKAFANNRLQWQALSKVMEKIFNVTDNISSPEELKGATI